MSWHRSHLFLSQWFLLQIFDAIISDLFPPEFQLCIIYYSCMEMQLICVCVLSCRLVELTSRGCVMKCLWQFSISTCGCRLLPHALLFQLERLSEGHTCPWRIPLALIYQQTSYFAFSFLEGSFSRPSFSFSLWWGSLFLLSPMALIKKC